MTDPYWVKIRSWHIAKGQLEDEPPKAWLTLCGRLASGGPIPDRPANEKTCESCLRIKVGR